MSISWRGGNSDVLTFPICETPPSPDTRPDFSGPERDASRFPGGLSLEKEER